MGIGQVIMELGAFCVISLCLMLLVIKSMFSIEIIMKMVKQTQTKVTMMKLDVVKLKGITIMLIL